MLFLIIFLILISCYCKYLVIVDTMSNEFVVLIATSFFFFLNCFVFVPFLRLTLKKKLWRAKYMLLSLT